MLKYLEIDSTYRDRQKFPNPTRFELLISQSGTRTSVYNSVDPVTDAAPRVTYCSNDINNLYTTIGIESNPMTTTISQTTRNVMAKFSSSLNASRVQNYYRGCVLRIADSSSVSTSIILSSEFLTTSGSMDYFRFTLERDNSITTLSSVLSVALLSPTNMHDGMIFIPTGEFADHTYDDWYIYNETRNEYSKILNYNGSFSLASIYPIQRSWSTVDTLSLRQTLPVTTGTFQAGSSTTSVFISSTTSDANARAYNGMFIRFTSGANKNRIIGIQSYGGSAASFRLDLLGQLSSAPTDSDTYEILPFTKDNYTPLAYNGSSISQDSCYDVQLLYLILPNLALATGGSISSQSYLLVELHNVDSSGGTAQNISYSNNPHSANKLFRVPITDIAFQSDDAFITLDKSNALQTLRINPFGNFTFGVYLSDGSELKYAASDTESPYPPNQFLQVSAVFALRRVKS